MHVSEQEGELVFDAEVDLGALDPGSIRVELYADSQDGSPAFKQEMHPTSAPRTQFRTASVHDPDADYESRK